MGRVASILVLVVGSGFVLGAALLFGGFAAAGVFFLFEVNFVMVFVDDLIFQVIERLVGQDAEFALEFPAPFPVFAHESFLEISIDKRMDIHNEAVHVQCVDQIINLVFQLVGKKQ